MKTKRDNLYIQVWIDPIKQDNLFSILNAEQWHTLCALATFINKDGECNPSLKKLKSILGLKTIKSVSKRVQSLERLEFQNNPILEISRGKKKNDKGVFIFRKNKYLINPSIITIFDTHPQTLIRREERMRKFNEMRLNLSRSLVMEEK